METKIAITTRHGYQKKVIESEETEIAITSKNGYENEYSFRVSVNRNSNNNETRL